MRGRQCQYWEVGRQNILDLPILAGWQVSFRQTARSSDRHGRGDSRWSPSRWGLVPIVCVKGIPIAPSASTSRTAQGHLPEEHIRAQPQSLGQAAPGRCGPVSVDVVNAQVRPLLSVPDRHQNRRQSGTSRARRALTVKETLPNLSVGNFLKS
jgi:hypothetical protein